MKTLIILSGGMDSATALAWSRAAGHEIRGAVHFQYGAKHNVREGRSASEIAAYYDVPVYPIQLEFMNTLFKSDLLCSGGSIPDGAYTLESLKKTVVPFRNGIMLSIAAGLAESKGADAVVLGNHYGDHAIYPDCRQSFIDAMSEAIRVGTDAEIQVLSPFCLLHKSDIAVLGNQLGVPYALTYTCYKGHEQHCGTCSACLQRKEAFQKAGVNDPSHYLG